MIIIMLNKLIHRTNDYIFESNHVAFINPKLKRKTYVRLKQFIIFKIYNKIYNSETNLVPISIIYFLFIILLYYNKINAKLLCHYGIY
jgi:hypothetical protein